MTNNSLSILARASATEVKTDPFPYLVIRDALDPSLFEELQRTFPTPEIMTREKGMERDTWHDYQASKVLREEYVSPVWRDFFSYHTSNDFYRDVLRVFEGPLRELNPQIENRMGKRLAEATTALREAGEADNPANLESDLTLECQFYMNYTRQRRAVRGPHVDRPTELYAALLYFRLPEDDSTGGDLEICAARHGADIYPSEKSVRISRLPAEIDAGKVEQVELVKYAPNTLVFFLNSAESIHAVTPRSGTEIPRRHINFCADTFPTGPLFDIELPPNLRIREGLRKIPGAWRVVDRLWPQ